MALQSKCPLPFPELAPKHHTLRENTKWLQWRGDIHFVMNNRTKHRDHFLTLPANPTLHRVVRITWTESPSPQVWIGSVQLGPAQLTELALNDGFDSVEDFFAYFNQNVELILISWNPTLSYLLLP